MAICTIVFSSALFSVEPGDNAQAEHTSDPSGWFLSIPKSFWWSLVTLTGVGYGDEYPMKVYGRSIAVVCAWFGIILVAVPIEVIGRYFAAHFRRNAFSSALERAVEDPNSEGGTLNLGRLLKILKDYDRKGLLNMPRDEHGNSTAPIANVDELAAFIKLYDQKGNLKLEHDEYAHAALAIHSLWTSPPYTQTEHSPPASERGWSLMTPTHSPHPAVLAGGRRSSLT